MHSDFVAFKHCKKIKIKIKKERDVSKLLAIIIRYVAMVCGAHAVGVFVRKTTK